MMVAGVIRADVARDSLDASGVPDVLEGSTRRPPPARSRAAPRCPASARITSTPASSRTRCWPARDRERSGTTKTRPASSAPSTATTACESSAERMATAPLPGRAPSGPVGPRPSPPRIALATRRASAPSCVVGQRARRLQDGNAVRVTRGHGAESRGYGELRPQPVEGLPGAGRVPAPLANLLLGRRQALRGEAIIGRGHAPTIPRESATEQRGWLSILRQVVPDGRILGAPSPKPLG